LSPWTCRFPTRAWSDDLSALNADIGRAKQVNMIVVLTKQPSENWFYALEETWVGGKKNDVTLVVSVDDGMKPRWVNVMAWATDNTFKVKLRDAVMGAGQVSRGSVLAALRQNVSDHFRRKPMAEFEYLKASMVLSSLQWVICLLIGVAVALGLAWLFTHLGSGPSYGFRHNRRRW
jgi:hypothetical protein